MKLEKEIIEYAYSSMDSATVDGLSSGIGVRIRIVCLYLLFPAVCAGYIEMWDIFKLSANFPPE